MLAGWPAASQQALVHLVLADAAAVVFLAVFTAVVCTACLDPAALRWSKRSIGLTSVVAGKPLVVVVVLI
jgi:hypothetical protein